MTSPLSTDLVRKRTATDLMPPPPPAKKIKRPKIALDEESYTNGLSEIIARDFFPGLLETRIQQEYLDALASQDRQWISSAGRRLRAVMTPDRHQTAADMAIVNETSSRGVDVTPSARGMETPASVRTIASNVVSVRQKDGIDTTATSLGVFQQKYTSEDNESFYKLLDRQNQKRAERHAWAWNGNKLPSKQMIAQQTVMDELVLTQSLVDDGFKRDRLAIRDGDDRPAQPDSWKPTGPKNTLMFHPEGVEDQSIADALQEMSRMGPKTIVYANTRAPDPERKIASTTAPARPGSPTMSEVRQAARGTVPSAYANSSVASGDETPRVNGYAFIDDEDDEDEPGSDEPPIINLGVGDATPNPFKIAELRTRETLHHRLVDRITKSKETMSRNGITGQTPTSLFPGSARGLSTGGLTPAGQRLLEKLATPAKATPIGAGMDIFASPRPGTLRTGRARGGKK